MSGFPKLIPAFTARVAIDAPIPVGALSSGHGLVVIPLVTETSSLLSEPNYPIKVNATFTHGADYIRQDPSGTHVRLDVDSVLKDESGAVLRLKYIGIINLSEETGKVLGGREDAKTTGFGDSVTQVQFETGSEELKGLGTKLFVGAGRFILESGKPTIVEYKISEVSA